ncbi:MAG TPA: hypothetical protein VIV60_37205, partial [Polyangiaceae bacterium]
MLSDHCPSQNYGGVTEESCNMGYLRTTVLGCCSLLSLGVIGCNSSDDAGVGQRALDSTEATTVTTERIDQLLTGLSDATATLD